MTWISIPSASAGAALLHIVWDMEVLAAACPHEHEVTANKVSSAKCGVSGRFWASRSLFKKFANHGADFALESDRAAAWRTFCPRSAEVAG